ncbi:hypothetical protein B0J14DRAFT_582995 [Halenospora varia]|nr:hypothetical protein B0J14DRAFT_582995 [Halenospora varia]
MPSNLRTPLYTLLTTPPLPKSPARQPDTASNTESNGDYFFVSTVQAPPPSAASPPVPQRNSPARLLKTPSSTKSQSYFTQRRHSNTPRYQNSPTSDNLSTPSQAGLSPKHSSAGSQHSSGGSVYSSNSGHSYGSNSSGEYLTPPRTEDNDEKPPYRPRRQSSDSLTLLRKTKRVQSMPPDTIAMIDKVKRRRKRKKNCRHKEIFVDEHQNRPYWWLPPSVSSRYITSPRQSPRIREKPGLNTGISLPTTPTARGLEIKERIFPKPSSGLAPPVTIRRWSAAATSNRKKSLMAFHHGEAGFDMSSLSLKPAHVTLRKLSRQDTSGVRMPAVVAPDIVQAIREKLTARKISQPHMPIPASITLRRASGTTTVSDMQMEEHPSTAAPEGRERSDQSVTSIHFTQNNSDTYLITSRDIDSITELITAEYQMKQQSDIRIDIGTPTPPSTSRTTRVPSITSKGLFPAASSTASSSLTTAQAQRFAGRRPMKNPQKLHVPQHPKGELARAESQKNMHEIIWQGGGSPSVSDVADDEDRLECNFSSLFSEPTTPLSHSNQAPGGTNKTRLHNPETIAFDPRNAKASIENWSWHCRQPIRVVIPSSSDSEIDRQSDGPRNSESVSFTNRGIRPKQVPTNRVRRQPRGSRSESQLLDVVSFPPLPRRTTSDWFSPLPEIEMASESYNSKCLYSIGLDITCGPSSCSSKTITPGNSSPTFVRNTAIPKCSSVDFRPYYNHWSKNMVRSSTAPLSGLSSSPGKDSTTNGKGTVDIRPKASPQTGLSAETGHFIGVASDKRRTSSTQSLQRVRTIDHKDKGSRAGTWSQRRLPSVCPPPISASPPEPVSGDVSPVLQRQESEVRRGQLLQDKMPPTPKVDHARIYRQLTGSGKKGVLSVCAQDCEPHICDDCALDPRKPSVDWIG